MIEICLVVLYGMLGYLIFKQESKPVQDTIRPNTITRDSHKVDSFTNILSNSDNPVEELRSKIITRHQEELQKLYNTQTNLSLFRQKYNLLPKQEIYHNKSYNNLIDISLNRDKRRVIQLEAII